ncbi:MAG: HPr family phosphocarrier protein [Ectothiorhodospiraceae bacterium]|jgi:phosphocarrier protein
MNANNEQPVEREVTIINRLGLHARAAARFVGVASQYDCRIAVHRGDKTVNGKSIMGVMMLAAAQGTVLQLEAVGHDAEAAITALETLIANRFEEAE